MVGVQNSGPGHAVRRPELDLGRQSSDVRGREHDEQPVQVVDRLVACQYTEQAELAYQRLIQDWKATNNNTPSPSATR